MNIDLIECPTFQIRKIQCICVIKSSAIHTVCYIAVMNELVLGAVLYMNRYSIHFKPPLKWSE